MQSIGHRLGPSGDGAELAKPPRGGHLIISRSPDWSFPSDHATASMAIVAAFALHDLPRRTLLFGPLALLICWSRIFVGTHYLTDVLGGSVSGVVAALLVWIFYREGSRLDRFATGIL